MAAHRKAKWPTMPGKVLSARFLDVDTLEVITAANVSKSDPQLIRYIKKVYRSQRGRILGSVASVLSRKSEIGLRVGHYTMTTARPRYRRSRGNE